MEYFSRTNGSYVEVCRNMIPQEPAREPASCCVTQPLSIVPYDPEDQEVFHLPVARARFIVDSSFKQTCRQAAPECSRCLSSRVLS